MLLTENHTPIPCGKVLQPGQLRLSRSFQETGCLLLIFDTKGTLRVRGSSCNVPAYAYMLLPFDEPFLPLQCSMPLQWAQLCVTPEQLREAGFRIGVVCTLAQPLVITEIWELLHSSSLSDSALSVRTQNCAAELLLCLLQRDAEIAADRAAQIPHYERLSALRREIYRNPAQSWSIQEICDNLCISRPYFHKIYLSAFGISCTQDVIESRIACAKELLEKTDDPVFDIAQRCGFESDGYFMRQFRKRTGMTPTAYRRICRQEHAVWQEDAEGETAKK